MIHGALCLGSLKATIYIITSFTYGTVYNPTYPNGRFTIMQRRKKVMRYARMLDECRARMCQYEEQYAARYIQRTWRLWRQVISYTCFTDLMFIFTV